MNQIDVDSLFDAKLNGDAYITGNWLDDCKQIRRVIRTIMHIELSNAEAAYFWSWRSQIYDASWLVLDSPKDICHWFTEFVEGFYEN